MIEMERQPDAAALSPVLLDSVLQALQNTIGDRQPVETVFRDGHSNDITEVRFDDGRTLIIKRGRYSWAAGRFQNAAAAGRLLRTYSDVQAPLPLELPSDLAAWPLQVYWRIDLPTLQDLWPKMSNAQRRNALRSWGELTRELHTITLPGHGPLLCQQAEATSAITFLSHDLEERLLPAVAYIWPEVTECLQAVLELLNKLGDRFGRRRAVLIHKDLHMGNIVCRLDRDRVRCVGLLDLETAQGGLPEIDAASAEVLHGPLFGQSLAGAWFEIWLDQYGYALDLWLRCFFRAYHLLNLGFYSAFIGHREHAQAVEAAVCREVNRLKAAI